MVIASFLGFLFLFTIIGIVSVIKSKKNTRDYLLAGHDMPPWLVALSAVATNNSGFMFTGMIGYTYVSGLSAVWVIGPWILGDFLASLFIHKKLRVVSEKDDALSFSGVLARWNDTHYHWIRRVSAIIIIIFLGIYAAAQLSAGSKALHVLLGWDYKAGAIIGSLIVLTYCFSGGIRASIWTDAAQSLVMVLAMGLLCFSAVNAVGGWYSFTEALYQVSPEYMQWFPGKIWPGVVLGPLLMIAGWISAGWGVTGQPHIMVRFMTMKSSQDMMRVRLYYYGWFVGFTILTLAAGFASRLLLPEVASFDSELALPTLAQQLLPDVGIGLILAGLFAATMSTADSQILSCSAALTRDLGIGNKSYIITKMGTVFVTVTALLIALYGNDSVFQLVLIAWSALAAAFSPMLTVYVLGGRISERLGLIMMGAGMAAMLLWRAYGQTGTIYEVLPGMIAGFAVYGIGKLFSSSTKAASQE